MTPLSRWLEQRVPAPLALVIVALIYTVAVFACLLFANYYGGPPIVYLDVGR